VSFINSILSSTFLPGSSKSNRSKELKEFNVLGDKLEAPKPQKPVQEVHVETTPHYSKKDSELIIFGESSDKIMYTLAKCCNPIPGDDVFGFVSTGKGLIIHRTSCPNAPPGR
jgi:GTP pyrophosphokinase